MKHRISLVLALTLSFLMMFSSIAKAEEIKAPISTPISEPTKIEIINKAPVTETNQVNCSLLRKNASNRILAEGKNTSKWEENQVGAGCGDCTLQNGKDGQCVRYENDLCVDCQPCVKADCGECRTASNACGRCRPIMSEAGVFGSSCVSCGGGASCPGAPLLCPAAIPDN